MLDIFEIYAGRLSGNVVMTGNVLLNGKKRLDYGGVVSIQHIILLPYSYNHIWHGSSLKKSFLI